MYIIIFALILPFVFGYERTANTREANDRSTELFNAVNTHRLGLGKPMLPYSSSMEFTAQLKCDDAEIIYSQYSSYKEYFNESFCGPYYSWSNEGPYLGVCYSTDPAIVRIKVSEVTAYVTDNFEVPGWSGNFSSADDCVMYWDSVATSYGDMIFNLNSYASIQWLAAGCAYSPTRCYCMVGLQVDTSQRAFSCGGLMANNNLTCGGVGVGICVSENNCSCFPGFVLLGNGDCGVEETEVETETDTNVDTEADTVAETDAETDADTTGTVTPDETVSDTSVEPRDETEGPRDDTDESSDTVIINSGQKISVDMIIYVTFMCLLYLNLT